MSNNVSTEVKKLNLFDIFCLGFGGAVGSGIFVLMGSGIAATGRSIVLAVVVGCLVMLLAYFFNVLLTSMFKFKGGDYSQKAIAFNPLFTGISGYITFINGFGIAMYSVAIINYSSIIFPGLLSYKIPLAILIITVFFAATIRGSKFVSILNSIMTIVLILSIFLFILIGFPKVEQEFFSGDNFFTNGFKGFVSAIAIMGWACQGSTMAPVSVSAVTKDSKKTIPLAILLITIAIAVVYGLMAYVASGVLPVEQVAGQTLSVVAEKIFPHWVFVIFILGGAVFAIATSMLGAIQMVRYPILKVAEDGWLPRFCTRTTKGGYPWVVYIVYYIMSIVPVLLGFSLDVIVSMVMIPSMLMNVYMNLACIKIIRDYPGQWIKSFMHMPRSIMNIICILAALCAGTVCYNLFLTLAASEMLVMISILVICTLFSFFCIKTGRVNKNALEANKKSILEEALRAETGAH